MKSFVRFVVRVAAAVLAVSQLGAGIAAAQSADLGIEKWVFGPGGPVAADAPLVYSIMAFNNGDDDAQDVVVTDVLPPGVVFESADIFWPEGASCAFDGTSNTVTCSLGTLAAFDASFIDLHVRAPSVAGTIENTATVSSSTPDPVSDNNSFTVSTEVVVFNLSDLAVTVEASADSVRVHRTVTFTTTVTNNGPRDAAGVKLSLFPPDSSDLSLTPSQGTCALNESDFYECLLGPLASGASATVTMEVTPQNDGFALVSAGASGYDDPLFFDPDSQNDFDSAVVNVNYPGNADPAYSTTTSQVVPFEMYISNPCTEDIIYLSGQLRQVVSLTFNNNRFRTNTYTNFSALTGVSLFTGTTYEASGGTRTGNGRSLVFNGIFPHELTILDNLRLVGGGETLLLHQNTHFTINANGTYTSVVDNPILECR